MSNRSLIFGAILTSYEMIQSLRRTKWPAFSNVPGFWPMQCGPVSSLEQLRYLATLVSAQGNSIKSSTGISRLIGSAHESGVGCSGSGSSERPKLVLKFLKDYGFSEIQIKSVVSRWPLILVSDPENILKPKVDFLFSKGITKSDFVKIGSQEPKLLTRSLEKHMIPLFDFLKDLAGSEENAARAVRNYPYVFRSSVRDYLELNTKRLQDAGVPKSQIAKLIVNRLRAFTPHPSRFEEALTMVKEMGFQPTKPTFGNAVAAIGWCSKHAWEGKMNLFRSYGLCDAEILAGFKKQPTIMTFRLENTDAKMNFFLNGMHWCPRKVLTTPHILLLSLEKRIIPRLSVLYLLASHGEVEEKEIYSVIYLMKMPETKFVEKFVAANRDRIPQVLEAHKGKLKIEDLHTLNTKNVFNRNEYWSGNSIGSSVLNTSL